MRSRRFYRTPRSGAAISWAKSLRPACLAGFLRSTPSFPAAAGRLARSPKSCRSTQASANCAFSDMRSRACVPRDRGSRGLRRPICPTRRLCRRRESILRGCFSSKPARRMKRCGQSSRRCVRAPAARCSHGRTKSPTPSCGACNSPLKGSGRLPYCSARRDARARPRRRRFASACKPGKASSRCVF